VKRILERFFAIDLRTLAAFRVGLGLTILADLGMRWHHFAALYTDDGALPRAIIGPRKTPFQAYLAGGSLPYTAAVAMVAALFALCLVLGYRSRVAAVASWFLLLSLHVRNPYVVDYGDMLLRTLLFWAMFLPLGGCWSMDARRLLRREPSDHRELHRAEASIATASVLLQFAFVYLFTALLKLRFAPAWLDGSALSRSLSLDSWVTPPGIALQGSPRLLSAATYTAFAFELLLPFALFCPWRTQRVRLVAVVAVALFHASSAVVLRLGLFPLICFLGATPFLPSSIWEKRGRRPLDMAREVQRERFAAPVRWPPRSLLDLGCAVALAYVTMSNLSSLSSTSPIPRFVEYPGVVLRLKQSWGMYVGDAADAEDGWFVVRATREDGLEIDLNRGGAPVVYEKPRVVSETHESLEWGSFMEAMIGSSELRQPMLRWQCERYNRGRDRPVQAREVELIFMDDRAGPGRRSLARRVCD